MKTAKEREAAAAAVPDPNTKPEDFEVNIVNDEETRRAFFEALKEARANGAS